MRLSFLLDWWENQNIMHQKLSSPPLTDPGSITPEADKSLIACVHESKIVAFESDAWIKTALRAEKWYGDVLGMRRVEALMPWAIKGGP